MVIHDPQPLGLIDDRPSGQKSLDLALSHRPFPSQRHRLGSSPFLCLALRRRHLFLPEFARQLSIPQYLFYPAIDPLSEKNRELPARCVAEVLARYQIDPSRPILTQISRFDRLKDPLGVIRAYRIVRGYFDCQLVLAGGTAPDDPEGAQVLKEVHHAADGDPDIKVLELPAWAPLEVNALQRASSIVIQKSLREGFGLTVSEALWKKNRS